MENFNAKEYEETLRRIEAKVKKEMKEEFLNEFARIALGVILGNILWSMGEYLLSL
jgi:hypothetical protein